MLRTQMRRLFSKVHKDILGNLEFIRSQSERLQTIAAKGLYGVRNTEDANAIKQLTDLTSFYPLARARELMR